MSLVVSYDMGWQKRALGNSYSSRSGHALVVGIHKKRIIDYVIYSLNCKKCEFKPKDDKQKGEGKEDGKGKREEVGGDLDESKQNAKKMWTSLFSRLRSTIDISDSPPEDGFIVVEVAHTIELSTNLTTSTDGIEPPGSLKPSNTQSNNPTLLTCSCSPDGKGTTFFPYSLKPNSIQNKITTPSITCNTITLPTSISSLDGKGTAKEVVYTPEYQRYTYPLEEG